jgi:hypothetical protein
MTLFVVAFGAVLFTATLAKGMVDPDFFWHVRTGELIARDGVPATDPYSFTWFGQPWTLHEWLGELLMYWSLDGLGERATLAAFAVLPVAIFCVLAIGLARRGIGIQAYALAAIPAALVVVPWTTLRPQPMSWLLLAALLAIVVNLRPDRPAVAWVLIPLFALWANLHGLWVVGLGVVGAYTLFTLLGRTPMAPARATMLAATVGAMLATALTPAGPIGILYPLRYLGGGDWWMANVAEWQSPDFHEPANLALVAIIVLLALTGGRGAPGWLRFVSIVGVVMALMAVRNSAVAAILAVPTLAMAFEARWTASRGARRQTSPSLAVGRRAMEAALAAVVVITAFVVVMPSAPSARPAPDRFPVAGVAALGASNPDARVFAEYGWAGYVISELHDQGALVFVDGRADMFDESILVAYSAVRAAEGEWQATLDDYDVDAILLPPDAPLVRGPAQDAGWCRSYADAQAVLLLRSCSET